MKTTEQKVIKFIDSKSLVAENDKLLIGLSGGPDSVFALKFFVKYKKKYRIDLAALHINHCLRGKESDKDEEFCASLCRREGIELVSRKIDVKGYIKKHKLSVEEAARQMRYILFEEVAAELGCSKIVTAHNMSDNTETVLLNLFKGTGINGLSGIPVRRGNIIRPFLCVPKDEITEYLKESGIGFRIDKTNQSNDYQRNYIRNVILKGIKKEINPSVNDAVFRTSQNLYKTKKILLRQIKGIIQKEIKSSKDEVLIPINLQEKYGDEILGEILKESLAFYHIEISFDDIEKISGLFQKQVGKSVELKDSVLVYREREYVKVSKRVSRTEIFEKLKIGSTVKLSNKNLTIELVERSEAGNSKEKCEFLDFEKLSDDFVVRNWADGDKFVPLGLKGFKKVSDFLTDIKVPSFERQNELVLLNGENIVWVIGHRIDERFKITDQTQKVVKLCLK